MEPRLAMPTDAIRDFCHRRKIPELSLLGSVLRDDFRPDSDVDVLVRFEQNDQWSLFDLVAMKLELETLFGRHVDLIEEGTIRNPYRRASIERGKQVLYAA